MQNIFNKYGENIFSYEIIEECLPKDCLTREQYWIDTLKPKFNTLPMAGSHLGNKKSNECKKKISESRINGFKNGTIAPYNLKKIIRSDGVIFNSVGEAADFNKGSMWSIAKVCTGRSYTYNGYSYQYLQKFIEWDLFIKQKKRQPSAKRIRCKETGQIFDSISQASKHFSDTDCHSKLSSHLMGKRKSFYKHTFEYYKEEENVSI